MENNIDRHPEYVALKASADAALELYTQTSKELRERLGQAWRDRGGCTSCRGRGWVVVWDTMDMMDGSCAEYGGCPNAACTPESRQASGLDPTIEPTKYDSRRGIGDPFGSTVAYSTIIRPLWEAYMTESTALKELEVRLTPTKGKRVRVFKGRKVPVGFEGTLFWTGPSAYGVRAGVKDDNGKVEWTYVANLMVV